MITDKFFVRTYEEAFCEKKEENTNQCGYRVGGSIYRNLLAGEEGFTTG